MASLLTNFLAKNLSERITRLKSQSEMELSTYANCSVNFIAN